MARVASELFAEKWETIVTEERRKAQGERIAASILVP